MYKTAIVVSFLLLLSPIVRALKFLFLEQGWVLAYVGVALSVGINGMGAAVGMTLISKSTAGASVKKPKVGSKGVLGIVVCEANVVFGVIHAIILNANISTYMRTGGSVVGVANTNTVNFVNSYIIFFSGLTMGICGLISSIGTGMVCSASIIPLAKEPKLFSKIVTMQLIVSGVGPFGFIVSMMMLQALVKQ